DALDPAPVASGYAARRPVRLGRPVGEGHARASAARARRVRGSRRAALPGANRALGAGSGTVSSDPAREPSELRQVLRSHRRAEPEPLAAARLAADHSLEGRSAGQAPVTTATAFGAGWPARAESAWAPAVSRPASRAPAWSASTWSWPVAWPSDPAPESDWRP